jgi:hypothetical protein
VVSNEKVTYALLAKKFSCFLGELSTKMKLTNPFNGLLEAKKKKTLVARFLAQQLLAIFES